MDLRTLLSSLSSTSRSFVVSTTKVIQQLKTRVVTCSRINCYVFKVYWSAGTQINEPIDWGTITRKWKTILGFSSPRLLSLWFPTGTTLGGCKTWERLCFSRYSNSSNNTVCWAENSSKTVLLKLCTANPCSRSCNPCCSRNITKNSKIRVAQGQYRTLKKPCSIKDRVA